MNSYCDAFRVDVECHADATCPLFVSLTSGDKRRVMAAAANDDEENDIDIVC